MNLIEILLALIKTLGMEESVKKTLVNLMPAESAFDALLNTGINLWGVFSSSIGLFGTVAIIALLTLMVLVAISPPDKGVGFFKPYGGLYSVSGLTTVLPGLNRYFVDPQQRIAIWLVNIFTKPWIFILVAQISMAITGFLLIDRAFVSDMLTSLFASPFSSITLISGTLFWVVFVLSAASFTMVAGLFAYPIIELGNAFDNKITAWIEEMMYASLVVPPMVAFLYRVAFLLNVQNQPVTGMVMWFAAIAIPLVIVLGGLVKALISIAIDIIIMYLLKGLTAKGFLNVSQLQKVFATGAILNRVQSGGSGSHHRKGLPTRLSRSSK